MRPNTKLPELDIPDLKQNQGPTFINFKRVAARVIKLWYFVVLSLMVAVTIAYLINRYSTRVYPVQASIIIKENDENIGAKFLYNNELINPYRNFYNEIYIMKSYPLLQEVMESLGFEVALFREGEIKTTEYYDPDFPVKFHLVDEERMYGKSLYFVVNADGTYSLTPVSEDPEDHLDLKKLTFGDTVQVNGYRARVDSIGDITTITDRLFIVRFQNPLNLAKRYSTNLEASWAQPGASVVNLQVTGEVPQKEVDFLKKFIERYQFYDVEKKNRVATMAIGFLDEQLVLMGDSLNRFEDQVEAFKRRNIITNLPEETNRLYQKLQGFEQQKLSHRLRENYFKYISELLKSDNYDGIFTPSSVGISDEVITNLITELIEEQTQVRMYRSNAGVERMNENPTLQSKLRRIELIKQDILRTIDNTRETHRININFVDEQIRLVEAELAKLPGSERELIDIQRNYSLRESLYVFLLQKRTEAGLSRASTTSDITIVNPPMALPAISPEIGQNYIIAGASGLVLPLLVFILLEVLNNRIQSKDDIENVTSVPVIGGIGHNPGQEQLVVYLRPRSAMAEAFRALRSNLNYFTANKDHQVFMVTSSIPGEGKSFTTLNLACVYALAGKRTLIMGADLRRPKLSDDLKLQNTNGLSQYLSGMAKLEGILQQSDVENLWLIGGGPMPPNPSELLLRPALTVLMNELRQRFDYIIMDTPPLSYVADAFVLAQHADHTLFVVRQNFTPKEVLASLEEFYNTGKLANISILFNDLRITGLGYGYGYNGYGYGYGYGYNYGYGYGQKKKDESGYYTE